MGAPTAGLLRAPLRCGVAQAALNPPYPLRIIPAPVIYYLPYNP